LIVDGTVRCWGSNLYHEIGNEAAQEANALPMKVSGLSGVTAIAAGGYHTCALATDHTVSCWGWNLLGQLGDGTTNDSETPVQVVGLSDVVEISAGSLHTCARLADQTVRCWGLDHQGQLGDGRSMVEAQPSPVVVSGLAGVVSVSAGDLLTCAALLDGSARCWGDDCEGQVGDGVFSRTAPVPRLRRSRPCAPSLPFPRPRGSRARQPRTANPTVGAAVEVLRCRTRRSSFLESMASLRLRPEPRRARSTATVRCGVGATTKAVSLVTGRQTRG
jgi:hypothetical protein